MCMEALFCQIWSHLKLKHQCKLSSTVTILAKEGSATSITFRIESNGHFSKA